MMNKDIITLNTNIVQSHQVTINIGIPMKREREADMPCRTPPMMSFSFSWGFDEKNDEYIYHYSTISYGGLSSIHCFHAQTTLV